MDSNLKIMEAGVYLDSTKNPFHFFFVKEPDYYAICEIMVTTESIFYWVRANLLWPNQFKSNFK